MKISELVAELQKIFAEKGDIQVGIRNAEYGNVENMTGVGVETRNKLISVYQDDEELGEEFVVL